MFKIMKSLSIVRNGIRRNSTYLPIGEFYAGRSVLITGGTGFVGKVFMEKLLYHCNDISKIYVLIRGKKNKTYLERLNEITTQPLFERLQKNRPEDLSKIVGVAGDVTLPQLGINPEVAENIQKEVSVVFHTAASVRFDDKLKELMNINIEGTRRAIKFSKKIHDLKAFVYVSTAYSQTQDKIIYEKVYASPGSVEDLYQYADLYDDDPVKYAHVLHGRANSYTQTKALTESLVANSKYNAHLPAIILRPSIITPVYKDPLPGWVDNFFGTTAYAASISKGINHVILGSSNNIIDLIPVDYVVNAMIVAAARYPSADEEVPVYNICSSYSNPLSLKDFIEGLVTSSRKIKLNDLPCYAIATGSKLLYSMMKLFTELLPAVLVDGWLWMWNKEQWYRKSLKILARQRENRDVFTFNNWIMNTCKSEHLAMSLSPEDRKKFEFHSKAIKWDKYLYCYIIGIKRYLLKK